MARKPKPELTWSGKGARRNVQPCVLLEDVEKSYRSERPDHRDDIFDNQLIHGDNLLALNALIQDLGGKVKCVYIDPPYNTGSGFEHYDDGLEHSAYLGMLRDRIELLRELMCSDGFFCCHIDDSEGHYLKVLLDEVFGRSNYLTTIYIQVRYPAKTLKQDMDFHKEIEYVHVYRKEYGAEPNLPRRSASIEKFRFYIEENANGVEMTLGGKRVVVFVKGQYHIRKGVGSEEGLKEIWATGTILDGNSSGRFFRDHLTGRVEDDGLGVLYKVYGIGDDKLPYRYFTGPKRAGATKGKYYQGVPTARLEQDAAAEDPTSPIENFYDLAGSFGNCRHEGGVDFRSGKKPESLLKLLIKYFSNEGDIVLDSFAGSGTTGAVAHKMGRRWVMVESGDQCDSHIRPRLNRVIDGIDGTGVTTEVDWKGGGGYRYHTVALSGDLGTSAESSVRRGTVPYR